MMKNTIVRSLTALAAATLITVGCGGGGAKVESVSTSTTMGQELKDLDEVYKQGTISEKEYERAKKDILKRYRK